MKCVVLFKKSLSDITVGFIIRDRLGNDVFGTNTRHLNVAVGKFEPGDELELVFELSLNLGKGHYSISMAVHQGYRHVENSCDWWDQCLVFQMVPGSEFSFIGTAALPVTVTAKRRTNE